MTDILVVDDERDIRELVSDILKDEGYGTRLAGNSEQAMREVNLQAPDLIILDIWLKDSKMDGIDILKTVKRDNPEVPVVIISGHGNIEIAVAAVKQGAYDFIEKPFNIDQLLVVVRRALEASHLRRENNALRCGVPETVEMIGDCARFKAFKSQLDKVSRSNGRIMLTGPSGAGKEVAARYIHAESPRSDGPFVVVSSATVEPDRMEDVLFGRETDDRGIEPGLFELAHGGVLFFDEVADMPIGTQSKILRVLIDQQFIRVGGSDTVRVDVRVISATNRDLQAEIGAGTFREELYHLLNVVPVDVPKLDERRDDIPALARHFIQALNVEQGLAMRDLSEDAEIQLQTMTWPGDVRQLKNTIERVLILGSGNGPITARELPQDIEQADEEGGSPLARNLAGMPLREAREMFEREYLLTQINRFGGNISRTASFVGMERSALHRKLKSLNVVSGARAQAQAQAASEQAAAEASAKAKEEA